MQAGDNQTLLLFFVIACSAALLICLAAARSALTQERVQSRLAMAKRSAGFSAVEQSQTILPEFDGEFSLRRLISSVRFQLKQFLQSLPLARRSDIDKLRRVLNHANFRSRTAVRNLIAAKFACAFLLGSGSFLGVAIAGYDGVTVSVPVGMVSGFLGLLIPKLVVGQIAKRRQERIQSALPNALDLLLLSAEAGLTLTAVLERVSKEISRASPEISQELELCVDELRVSVSREDAFRNLYERTGVVAFRSLALTLVQGERFGTSLGVSIRTLADEKRKERMLTTEAKAARLPVIMTFPMLVFFIPPIFIVVLSPIFMPFLTGGDSQAIFGD